MTAQLAADVVLDAPPSVAIYLAALRQAGRASEAGSMFRAHGSAVEAAVEVLTGHALWTPWTMPAAIRPHSYERADSEVTTVDHESSPVDAPSLHTHVLVGREVVDRASLQRALPYVWRQYERRLADELAEIFGLALRREAHGLLVDGVPEELTHRSEPTICRIHPGARQHRASPSTA